MFIHICWADQNLQLQEISLDVLPPLSPKFFRTSILMAVNICKHPFKRYASTDQGLILKYVN